MVTYGTLTYTAPLAGSRARGTWTITAVPHVIIMVKRVFPQARPGVVGEVVLTATDEAARTIEWFTERWPLTVTSADGEVLARQAQAHRHMEQTVADIVAGVPVNYGHALREPAQQSRRYQRAAADLVSASRRVLLTDDLGLGKTHTALLTLRNPNSLPAVVVVPTNLPTQWQRQLAVVWPDLTSYIPRTGKPDAHFTRWVARNGAHPDVVILPYSKLAGWQHHLQPLARTVIFDEAQELRRGTDTDKGSAAANLSRDASYVVGATATPVYNYGGEIYSILNIVAPGVLGTREEFLREWGGRSWSTGSHTHSTVHDPKALSLFLRSSGVMIGRTRAEVGQELPFGKAQKIPHWIDADPEVLNNLTGDAVELARLILAQTTDAQRRFSASGRLDNIIRQATGIAKAPFVAAFVQALIQSESTPKVVLWGWHHACYDMWTERLTKAGLRVVRYTGTESPAVKEAAVAAFADTSRAGAQVMIMSLRSGAGLDGLQSVCHTGVFGELDWSGRVMDQCAGRLARDGQVGEVLTYYLVSDHGADPEMVRVLGLKNAQATPFEDPYAQVVSALPNATERVRALAEAVLQQAQRKIS